MTIPDVQTPAENSFDAAADLMIGKATKTYNSLSEARENEIPLLWQRIVSHADITLKGLQGLTENEVITTIVLTADAGAKLVGERDVNIQNGDISVPTTIANANILTINGTNLKVNNNNVEFWAAVMPATVKSLNIAVETNKATYTRNIESCNIEFKQNARKGLNVDMSSVERVEKEAPASWIATDLADITATDEVVITMAKGKSVYALTSAKGSSDAPTAVAVTVKDKELTATPADNLVWNVANADGDLTIYPKGQTDTWLYTTNNNDGVRVGTGDNKIFVIDSGYLKNTKTNRYLGVYLNNPDWRCYTSTSTNIGSQTLCFYVKGTPKTALETPANLQVNDEKVVSWDAVSGAASYNVTIGTKTYTSETNSYNASALADEYYDVTVVAVPSDKDNYKNSAAATFTGVKFGTPTLATPTLKEGVIDRATISVSWSVDERATAGYNCELFKGGVKVGESQTVNAGAVTFTGLDAETAYVIKVNAIAVEGAKSYAASPVATLDVTTKAAGSAAAKTYTLTFASSYNDPNAGSYKNSWKATRDGFTWKMENWNNNNNYNDRWTYVRAGSKSAASVATITTAAMPEAISTVTMTIDKITATNVKTIKLEVLSADEKTVKETITADKEAIAAGKADNCVFKITNPQQGCKYKITVACQKGSSNGFVQVSKVVYTNN